MQLSQRALGMMFRPPVTTQFISNLERGVTPLPLNHVPILTKALKIDENELLNLLEKEYTLKVSGRLAKIEGFHGAATTPGTEDGLRVEQEHIEFMKELYEGYRRADGKTRQIFHNLCETVLPLRK